MKITDIETLPVSVGGGYDYAVIIVLVRTDEGLTGIGEASLAGQGRGVLAFSTISAKCWSGRIRGRSSTGGVSWFAARSGRPGR